MRIITDGEKFAVARFRWIFTQILSANNLWLNIKYDTFTTEFNCWTTLEEAKNKIKKYKVKYWTYKDE